MVFPTIERAIQQLNDAEGGEGCWTIGVGAFMFNSMIPSQYPVVARVLDGSGHPIASNLDPDYAAAKLLPAFFDV